MYPFIKVKDVRRTPNCEGLIDSFSAACQWNRKKDKEFHKKDMLFFFSFECILKHFLTLKPLPVLRFFCSCQKTALSDCPVFSIAIAFDKALKFCCEQSVYILLFYSLKYIKNKIIK